MSPLIIPLLTTILQAVAQRYITDEDALDLITFGLSVADEAAAAEARLSAIQTMVEAKKAEAAANSSQWKPDLMEIKAVLDQIRARDTDWAAL